MKKLFKTMMVLSMASLAVLSSCKKDKTDDPTIADATIDINAKVDGVAINSGDEVTTGKVVKFTIISTGNSDNKLKSISMTSTAGGSALLTKDLSGTSSTDTATFNATTTGTVSFTVSLTSEKGNVTKSFSVKVVTPPNIDSDNPQLGNQAAGAPIFWASTTKTTYKLSDVKNTPSVAATIDFGYVTRSLANGGNKLVGPTSQDATDIYATQWSAAAEKITTWNKRNNTLFKEATNVTVSQFDNAQGDVTAMNNLIVSAKNAGEPTLTSTSVGNGRIYLFKTEAGYYGLIKVVDASGDIDPATSTANAGAVSTVVYFQKP